MSYRYRILSKSEDRLRENDEKSCREMDLAYIAADIAAMKCKIKCPAVRFIVECGNGYITRDQRIDGYSPNHKEIFLRTGMPPARVVEIALHETRHCSQWSKGWAGRSDYHCEADAQTFLREFWQERRVESDPEKILLQLCEIGMPLAMAANDVTSSSFYLDELKAVGHPAAARLEKQFADWSRRQVRAETPRNLQRVPATLDEIRKHYFEVILPAQAERFIKPHMRAFQWEYSKEIPR
jgi:hypothetical protein